MKIDRTEAILIFVVLLLFPAAHLLSPSMIDHLLFSVARALAVLGLLLLWRCGLISFGHGLYFGIGGYAVAIAGRGLDVSDIILRLFVAMVAAGVTAFFLGFILRRYRGIFFAMLSLAFSMVLYGALVKSEALGSTDGFSIHAPTLLTFHLGDQTRRILFIIAGIAFALAAMAIHRYLRSILGAVGEAIRDNEIRVAYLGFSVSRTIHINYILSAILAGAGGALMAMAVGQVDPDSMVNWTVSGELVFVAILSGYGSVLAPVLGSILFEFLRSFALEVAPQGWHFIVGATLLLIIFALPRGLWSLIEILSSLTKRVEQ